MTDRILVERIAVFAHHGLLPEETRLGQRFYLSLDCALDLGAGRTRRRRPKTVSYADLTAIAVSIATERRFDLIEALARGGRRGDPRTLPDRSKPITVRVDKPSAPVPAILDGVAVLITRTREVRS